MLEAQPLHGVGQLDVDAEIVGIQLELIALEQAGILVDVHGQRRDIALDRQLPVPVARRIGLRNRCIWRRLRGRDLSPAMSHPCRRLPWICLVRRYMHNNACFRAMSSSKAQKHAFCFMFMAAQANAPGRRIASPSAVRMRVGEVGDRRERLRRRLAMRRMSRAGDQADIDRAVAFAPRDLDLPHGAVLIVLALHDLHRHADIGEVVGNIPVAEFRIEPGAVPAIEGVVDILVPARQLLLQVRWSRRSSRISAIEATEISSTMKCGAISDEAAYAMILMRAGIDRRDRGAVGMAEQQTAAKADRVEQFRQHVERLALHVVERARQFHRRRMAIAGARIGEHAGAGRGLKFFGKVAPQRRPSQALHAASR